MTKAKLIEYIYALASLPQADQKNLDGRQSFPLDFKASGFPISCIVLMVCEIKYCFDQKSSSRVTKRKRSDRWTDSFCDFFAESM